MIHKRQGDLLFVSVSSADKTGEAPEGGILAHGEATGHKHQVKPTDLSKCEVFMDSKGRLIVQAKEAVKIVHEEHGPIILEEGTWEVRRQVEYQPDGWTQVSD